MQAFQMGAQQKFFGVIKTLPMVHKLLSRCINLWDYLVTKANTLLYRKLN